jgi:hypothetical protein
LNSDQQFIIDNGGPDDGDSQRIIVELNQNTQGGILITERLDNLD